MGGQKRPSKKRRKGTSLNKGNHAKKGGEKKGLAPERLVMQLI